MNFLLRIAPLLILPFFLQKQEVPVASAPIAEPIIEMTNYCNDRYSFCVEYPSDEFPIQMISDNGDGIVLSSEKGDVSVTVAGSWSVLGKDSWLLYDEFVAERLDNYPDSKVRYAIVRKYYYEVMYTIGEQHYYQKLYNQGSKYVELQIIVPKGQDYKVNALKEKIDIHLDSI